MEFRQHIRILSVEDNGCRMSKITIDTLRVTIIARTMTCEEYEDNQSQQPTLKEEDFHENHHRQPD